MSAKKPQDEKDSAAISVRAAVILAGASFVVGGLGLRWWQTSGGEFPVVPWISVLPLLLVATLVLYSSWQIRTYIQGKAVSMPSPQRARGSLVAAQAAALGGAALAGVYFAYVALNIPNADVPSVRDLMARAAVSGLAAIIVSGCGFVAQQWCRVPPDEDEDYRSRDPDRD